MKDLSRMWQVVLEKIETSVSRANFSTWFKDTNILRKEGKTIYLGVPNSFTQEWLQKKFHKDILRILKQIDPKIGAIEYVINKGKAVVREGEISKNEFLDYYTYSAIDYHVKTKASERKEKIEYNWFVRAKSEDLNIAKKAFEERWGYIKENLRDKKKLNLLKMKFNIK